LESSVQSRSDSSSAGGLLASEDETFFQVVQNIPPEVCTTEAGGRITFYNEAAAAS
jgi:hypothetical protein